MKLIEIYDIYKKKKCGYIFYNEQVQWYSFSKELDDLLEELLKKDLVLFSDNQYEVVNPNNENYIFALNDNLLLPFRGKIIDKDININNLEELLYED